jgi:hypothetical protein
MKLFKIKLIRSSLLTLALATTTFCSSALTLDELRNLPNLTPKKFARQFSEFRYEYGVEVQSPSNFLAREAGDCDDFALVASIIFSEKGYHPRMFLVRMRNLAHVVCYFPETHSYIDYNDRSYLFATTSSDGTMRDIAKKVAKSLDLEWTSVAEFNFVDGLKELVAREENPRALIASR